MSVYTGYDVKSRAMEIFLDLVRDNRPERGKLLTENTIAIYNIVLANIQRIGIHSYAELVLKSTSSQYNELVEAIDDWNE